MNNDAEAATRFTEQSQALIHLLWSALGSVRSADTEYRAQRSRSDFARLAGEIAEIARSCAVEDCITLTESTQHAMKQAPPTPEAQRYPCIPAGKKSGWMRCRPEPGAP